MSAFPLILDNRDIAAYPVGDGGFQDIAKAALDG